TDGDGSHGSTSKTPSYTKSVSWHHYHNPQYIIQHLNNNFTTRNYLVNSGLYRYTPVALIL
ncbi:hypothetical protein, partial [Escherichia coli]|uniref:hypothetical protein n=1 Tax=Escherichia coli TaxID=562 RepID=UPI003EE305D3